MFPNFGALVPLPHHFDTRSGFFQKRFPNIYLFQQAVSRSRAQTYKKVKTEKRTKYELPKTEPSSLRTESVRSGSGASFLYEWVMLRTSSFSSTSSFSVTGDNSRRLSIRFKTLIVVPLPPPLRIMATRYLNTQIQAQSFSEL